MALLPLTAEEPPTTLPRGTGTTPGLDAEARLGRRGRDDARRRVAPVVVHPSERQALRMSSGISLDGRIVRTGLEQEHGDVGVLAQPSGEDAAGRAGADDDDDATSV